MTPAAAVVSHTDRLSIRSLAAREHVHPNTIRSWITDGIHGHRLAMLRIGGRVFVRNADWQEFVASLNGDSREVAQ